MGSAKTKSYDRNRFKKVYPRFRGLPSQGLMSDGEVVLEALKINLDNESSKTFTLEQKYSSIPSIVLTPLGDINNVNVWVSSVTLASVPSGGGRTVTVIIETSVAITGIIHLQATQV
jgi:hypothetical protein